jgi:two-component system sensor histidine kinase BaeS
MRRVSDAFSADVAKGSLTFEMTVEPGLELAADERQVERALDNLMSNAVKFTPAGGRIDLFARTDGGEIVFDVRDTGLGIAAAEIDALFTRFFSSSGVRRRATLGTGLGLYIVKEIADGHDGSVRVVSVPGHGSTFTMRLPVRPKVTRRRAGDRATTATHADGMHMVAP